MAISKFAIRMVFHLDVSAAMVNSLLTTIEELEVGK